MLTIAVAGLLGGVVIAGRSLRVVFFFGFGKIGADLGDRRGVFRGVVRATRLAITDTFFFGADFAFTTRTGLFFFAATRFVVLRTFTLDGLRFLLGALATFLLELDGLRVAP